MINVNYTFKDGVPISIELQVKSEKKTIPKMIKSGCKVGGNKRVKKSELLIPTMVNTLEIFNEFLRDKKKPIVCLLSRIT